jgi:hypothetical protein
MRQIKNPEHFPNHLNRKVLGEGRSIVSGFPAAAEIRQVS